MAGEIKKWLQSFCLRRGLDRPDGRWLYLYQTTASEYEELRLLLSCLSDGHATVRVQHDTWGLPAGFALYAAEWWKREYAGSHWSWLPILEALRIDPTRWPRIEQQSCLVTGLRYWGQTPRTAGMAYLGAIASQAGLPMRVLADNSGTIADLLGRVMRKSARLGLTGDDIAAVVKSDQYGLPESLRLDQTIALIANMVEVVLDLRREHKLAKNADAVAELDRCNPDWRNAFPLLIEDGAARRLMEGLVRDAAQVTLSESSRGIVIQRVLNEGISGSWSISSRAVPPSNLPTHLLERWLNAGAKELPRLLLLEVAAGDVHPVATGVVLPGLEDRGYRLERHSASWVGANAIGTHRLSLRVSSRAPSNAPLVGGEALDGELPWVFVKGEQEWLFVAEGSAEVSPETAIVAIPSGARVSGPFTVLGTESTCNRQVVEIRASVTISTAAGDTYRITPSVRGAEQEELVWEGRRCWEETTPGLVFRGRPRLASFDPDDNRRLIRGSDLQWVWKDGSEELGHGTASVIWRRDGLVVRRWTLVIVPEAAAVVLRPESLDAGGVLFTGFGFKGGACEGLGTEVATTADGELCVRIPSGLAGRSAILISVWWRNPAAAIVYTLSPPVRGVQVITHEGALPGTSVRISQRNLYGARLRLTEANAQRQGLYAITIGPKVTGNAQRWATKVAVAFQNATAEFRLIDFREMVDEILAGNEGIHAQADIEVTNAGRVEKLIEIGKSDVALEIAEGLVSAPLALDLFAVDLSSPTFHRVDLPMDPSTVDQMYITGLSILAPSAGPWFLASRAGALPAARPTVIDSRRTDSAATASEAIPGLRGAICVRELKARDAAIFECITKLLADAIHEDWALVGQLLEGLGHVSLAGFDLWRAMARSPQFALSILCHAWESESTLRAAMSVGKRLDSELPFLWEAVPAGVWRSVLGRLFQRLKTQLSEEPAKQVFTALVKEIFAVLPMTLGMLRAFYITRLIPATLIDAGDMAAIRETTALGPTPFRRLLPMVKGRPESLFQGVIQRRHDSQWPVTDSLRTTLCAIASRRADADKELAALFRELIRDVPTYQQATLLLPCVLAIGAANDDLDDFVSQPALIKSARILRNFDKIYFEDAYRLTSIANMAAGSHTKYEWTDPV